MNYLWAFCVGGAICLAGQLLIDLTSLTPARILTGYVVAGVVLSAAGWYEPLAQWQAAGATVPLLGFGHLLAKVRTALAQQGPMGILTGGLPQPRPGSPPVWCAGWCAPGWAAAMTRTENRTAAQRRNLPPKRRRRTISLPCAAVCAAAEGGNTGSTEKIDADRVFY